MSFWSRKRDASVKPEQDQDKVRLHISSTGRVWVDPKEVVLTGEFQRQREAVRRLREAQEKATMASA